jgi:putative MFS transporter
VTPLRTLPPYSYLLFVLLWVATSFEGFDTNLATLILPKLGGEFGVAQDSLGFVLSLISLGTMASFFVVRLADRYGRKPVIVVSLAGYGALTLATYFANSLLLFALLQFGARMLMVTQLALAYVMLSEELPADLRGRANGLLGAAGSAGAALPALFLAPFEATSVGWRGLFLVGALPLLLVPLFITRVRETRAFEARRGQARESEFFAQTRVLFGPRLRSRTLAMSALWFVINFWSAAVAFFFYYYVQNERGWVDTDLAIVAPAAVPFAFLGYVVAGWLCDAIGRKPAALLYLVLGAGMAIACYQATGWWTIAACWVGIQTLLGVWVVANTLTAELFPTEVRAAANGLTLSLVGRSGFVVAPMLTGTLSVSFDSTGHAVSLLALVNLLAIPIIVFAIPETRGLDLAAEAPTASE